LIPKEDRQRPASGYALGSATTIAAAITIENMIYKNHFIVSVLSTIFLREIDRPTLG
jgi:hypothetical protein